ALPAAVRVREGQGQEIFRRDARRRVLDRARRQLSLQRRHRRHDRPRDARRRAAQVLAKSWIAARFRVDREPTLKRRRHDAKEGGAGPLPGGGLEARLGRDRQVFMAGKAKSTSATHERLVGKDDVKLGSDRSFGFVIAGVLALIAAIRLWHGESATYFLIGMLALAVPAAVWPRALRPLNLLWYRFGLLLHA